MGAYGIRSEYRPNPRPRAPNRAEAPAYWTPDRVRKSFRHQYYAYRYARDVALRSGARRVLDVGCGVATKLCRLFDERFELFGVDQREAISRCQELCPRGHWFVEDLEEPGPALRREAARGFDLIIASDVIEHLLDPDALLRYLRELASQETRIVLSTPERDRLLGPDALKPSNPEHVREWSFGEFRRYVEGAGFRVLDHRRQLPHALRPDAMSLRFLRRQLGGRRSLRTSQVLLCRRDQPDPGGSSSQDP